ncbi:MAG: hypothetical protein FWE28_03005 [Oscillospiraceae bacterium]|nr:hypothetical protein [Oscillospiraceae bacterium]
MKKLLWVIAILALLAFTACTGESQDETIIEDTTTITDTVIFDDHEPTDLPEDSNTSDKAETIDTPATPPPHHGEIIEMGGGHSNWMIYDDVAHMTSHNWVSVFRGEVLDERPEWFGSYGSIVDDPPPGTTAEEIRAMFHSIFTVYRVRVTDVFQGDMQPGDIVEVMQEGGERGGFRFGNREEIPIAVGDDLVFFAALFPEFPALPGGLMNPYQTVYRFVGSNELALSGRIMIEELESVYYSHHNIPVTLGDLLELKVKNFSLEAAFAMDWVDETELQEYLARR